MLPDDRRDRIIRLAREALSTDVNDYLATLRQPSIDFRQLLERSTTKRLNPIINALLHYGAGIYAQTAASSAVSWSSVAYPTHPKPASWLMRDSKTGFACIMLDKERVNNTPYGNLSRLLNYLCLHEIGHIFLHWNRFFAGTARVMADHASASEEAEAWCFCVAMILVVAEQIAEDFRNTAEDRRQDALHVWELISDLRL